MKNQLDADTGGGTVPESATSTQSGKSSSIVTRDLVELSESSMESSTNWWASLTQTLDKETGGATSQSTTPLPSPASSPSRSISMSIVFSRFLINLGASTTPREGGRARATSMSAAYGRPEEDNGTTQMLRIYNGIYRGETTVGPDNNLIAQGFKKLSCSVT